MWHNDDSSVKSLLPQLLLDLGKGGEKSWWSWKGFAPSRVDVAGKE